MAKLSVALLQLDSPGPDPELAWQRGEQATRHAAARGADVVLFPEMWQIGYTECPSEPAGKERWLALATEREGEFVSRFAGLAQELGVAIVATYLERTVTGARNAATLIDRHGNSILHYAKVHTCDFGMEEALEPGTSFEVATLDTDSGQVDIGVMICYDREFPESARLLMLRGAEVILVPNSCYFTVDRMAQLRTRAYENMVGLAMTNYPQAIDQSGQVDYLGCNGMSAAFSGMCFDEDGVPMDQELVVAGSTPSIEIAEFDLAALRAYRAIETWGDAYRKPDTYARLAQTGQKAPIFQRHDPRQPASHEGPA